MPRKIFLVKFEFMKVTDISTYSTMDFFLGIFPSFSAFKVLDTTSKHVLVDACDIQKKIREIGKLSRTFSSSREYSQKQGQ